MAFALFLTSCSFGTQIQNQDIPDTSTSIQEEKQTVQNPNENAKKSEDKYAYAQLAKMTPLETKIQLDKNTLSYGKLQITLPDGVTIEEQKTENDTRVIDLIGVENENAPFPPRIWLSHYQAVYQNKWELASALLDILPDTTLRIYDKLGDNLHYLFTYNKQNKNGYVLAYQNDICIVEEIVAESGYSFGKLLETDAVHWEDSIQKLDVRRNNIDYADLNKIKAEKDCTLLAVQSADKKETREISLFRDGCFLAPIMQLSFAECPFNIEFEDYNFDGCQDMNVWKEELYLWNAEKKQYEAAQLPDDFSWWSLDEGRYSETQTIWEFSREYVGDADGELYWDIFDETETLWKWERTALTKKRECVAKVREDGVRIMAYEENPENVLFDEIITVEEWEQNSATVQKCYQQFYMGMLPEERSGNLHKTDYAQEQQEYIPQALLDQITKAMLNGTVPETLEELRSDKKLTDEEILTLAKDNLEMRSDVTAAKQSGDFIMAVADGDNDGVMDLIGEEYYDGYGCYMECIFYQGQKDGTYQKTHSHVLGTERIEWFDVLSYEGKNYLCHIPYGDGEKKDMSLECYIDGVVKETADLVFFPEKYDIRLAECADNNYRSLAEDILKNSISYKEKIDEDKNIDGKSEQKTPTEQYGYQCDLNNDGVPEKYDKYIWAKDMKYLNFYGEGTVIEQVYKINQLVEGRAFMLWAEPLAGENIINILSLTEWENFEITGFLLNGEEYKKLYRITADAVYGVRQERFYT